VTTKLLLQLGGAQIDSNIPYQAAYSAIWAGGADGAGRAGH
jgi:hypothetical protein